MTGIDLVINDLQTRIGTIDYMKTVYGRATIMQELWGDANIVTVPKVWNGTEYAKPLPNDNDEPLSFFQALKMENFGQFDRVAIGNINRQISVTFWGKLGNGDTPASTEDIKFDFIERLQKSPYVSAINSFVDERYQDVFPDFAGYFGKLKVKSEKAFEQQTQWLMQPFGGFRLVFTVNYIQTPRECR
jgi:hypothetical protein